MSNKEAKLQIRLKYGSYCFMTGYKLNKDATYHHIVKKQHGGLPNAENGAILSSAIHNHLHSVIEHENKQQFALINECLNLYKKCMDKNEENLIEQYEGEIMPFFRQMIKKK